MDPTLIGYTVSVLAALLAVNTYSHWGVTEVHAYTIPPYLEQRGYTARTVANQVVDAMRRIQVEVTSFNEVTVVVQGKVEPVSEAASYFGVVELLRATETMIGLNPRTVELEVTQRDKVAHWRVRGDDVIRGYEVRQGDAPLDDADALIDELALQVTGYVSPFEALSYTFIRDSASNSYDRTVSEASRLLLDCQHTRAWACTDANLKNAYLLRGMAFLYSERSSQAFNDFDAANKIGTGSALGVAIYGDAFAALGQDEAARRQYARAKTLDPAIGQRFFELAKGYAHGGNFRLADRRFSTAAELGVDSEAFLVAWGDTLSELGWHKAALEKYRAAEAVDPDSDLYADRIDRARKALDDSQSEKQPKPAAGAATKG